jgi:murein DD-endopeptidase MepM/ murein hydrolase activator NlpD
MKYVFTLTTLIALSACTPFQPYSENASDRYYIVQSGDNFDSIAFVLETTPGQLKRANPWANSGPLQPGMRLSIPQPIYDSDPATVETGDYQIRSADYIWPLQRFEVSSDFGFRGGRLHSGVDLRAPRGTPIHAAADGRITFSGYKGAYGQTIVIDHGQGIETTYAHNSRNLVQSGQRVEQGEVIARVGRSGNATGYHVHFEFRMYGQALNPAHRIQAAR